MNEKEFMQPYDQQQPEGVMVGVWLQHKDGSVGLRWTVWFPNTFAAKLAAKARKRQWRDGYRGITTPRRHT